MGEAKESYPVALHAIKQGKRVAREGWNGKNMFLFLVKGDCVKKSINESYDIPSKPESFLDVCDAIYMKTADNKLIPWLCSQADALSNDWVILD
jgi:hypothetical protein